MGHSEKRLQERFRWMEGALSGNENKPASKRTLEKLSAIRNRLKDGPVNEGDLRELSVAINTLDTKIARAENIHKLREGKIQK